MYIVYSPVLCLIALYESKYGPVLAVLMSRFQARTISLNRLTGLADDERNLGWGTRGSYNPESSGWADKVRTTIPHIEEDEIYYLRKIEKDIRSITEKVSSSEGTS
jgi:hypothetical protein